MGHMLESCPSTFRKLPSTGWSGAGVQVIYNMPCRLWTEEEWNNQTFAVLDLGTTDTEVNICQAALLHAMWVMMHLVPLS